MVGQAARKLDWQQFKADDQRGADRDKAARRQFCHTLGGRLGKSLGARGIFGS